MSSYAGLCLTAAVVVAVVGTAFLLRLRAFLGPPRHLPTLSPTPAEVLVTPPPGDSLGSDALERLRGQLGTVVAASIVRACRDEIVPHLTRLIDRLPAEPRTRPSTPPAALAAGRTLRLVPATQDGPAETPDRGPADSPAPGIATLLARARRLVEWAEEGTHYITSHDVAGFSELDRRIRSGYADEALDQLLPALRRDVAAFERGVGPGVLAEDLRHACDTASAGVQQYWLLWSQLRERRPVSSRISTAIDAYHHATGG